MSVRDVFSIMHNIYKKRHPYGCLFYCLKITVFCPLHKLKGTKGAVDMGKVSLCMIVRDEEDVLERCLKSVRDMVDEIIIVDTGSQDRTKEIAADFTDKIFDFEWIDVRFPGTGDIFSAVLISDLLNGKGLKDATAEAMTVVRDIIGENLHKKEKFFGVDIEKYISEGKL